MFGFIKLSQVVVGYSVWKSLGLNDSSNWQSPDSGPKIRRRTE